LHSFLPLSPGANDHLTRLASTLIKTEPSLLMEIEPLAVTVGEYGPQV